MTAKRVFISLFKKDRRRLCACGFLPFAPLLTFPAIAG